MFFFKVFILSRYNDTSNLFTGNKLSGMLLKGDGVGEGIFVTAQASEITGHCEICGVTMLVVVTWDGTGG